jgi:preprotein translocase subunit SecG
MGLITVMIIFVCVLLVLVVLIQNSKGGGIASNFASNTQVVGVKRQAEIIEKVTWGLVIALMLLCLAASSGSRGGSTDKGTGDSAIKNAELPVTQPGPNVPVAPGNNQPPIAPGN